MRPASMRQPEPQHIHRRAERLHGQACRRAHGRIAAIRPDAEVGADLEGTVRRRRAHAGDAIVLVQKIADAGAHVQREARIAARVAREEIEEVPLWHQHDERAAHRQVAEVRKLQPLSTDDPGQLPDLLVG